MDASSINIVPITKARGKLGDLADKVSGENYVVLTKGGNAKAALVDINYLAKLQKEVANIYKKTFIDSKLLPYTREFTDKEIAEWQKEDAL